jgi:hypothetical protein
VLYSFYCCVITLTTAGHGDLRCATIAVKLCRVRRYSSHTSAPRPARPSSRPIATRSATADASGQQRDGKPGEKDPMIGTSPVLT